MCVCVFTRVYYMRTICAHPVCVNNDSFAWNILEMTYKKCVVTVDRKVKEFSVLQIYSNTLERFTYLNKCTEISRNKI